MNRSLIAAWATVTIGAACVTVAVGLLADWRWALLTVGLFNLTAAFLIDIDTDDGT